MNTDIQQIWTELNTDLERYICNKVNHQDHCNDILQEVYLKLVDNVEKIKNVENVKGYLIRISSNTIADHYRSSKYIDTAAEVDAPFSDTDSCVCNTPDLAHTFLQRMIDHLPEKYRDALVKTELQGLSQKEYAKSLGISVSGAKSRVQRAREKLKDLILQCCDYQFDKYGNVISCCGEEIDQPGRN